MKDADGVIRNYLRRWRRISDLCCGSMRRYEKRLNVKDFFIHFRIVTCSIFLNKYIHINDLMQLYVMILISI